MIISLDAVKIRYVNLRSVKRPNGKNSFSTVLGKKITNKNWSEVNLQILFHCDYIFIKQSISISMGYKTGNFLHSYNYV